MWNCDCLKINKYFKTFHFLFSWSSPSLSPIWCFTIVVVTHVQHVNLCPFCCWQFVVNSICTTYYRTINLERNRQTEKEKDRQCHDKIETTDYDKYDRNMNFLRLNSNSPTTGWTLKLVGTPAPAFIGYLTVSPRSIYQNGRRGFVSYRQHTRNGDNWRNI